MTGDASSDPRVFDRERGREPHSQSVRAASGARAAGSGWRKRNGLSDYRRLPICGSKDSKSLLQGRRAAPSDECLLPGVRKSPAAMLSAMGSKCLPGRARKPHCAAAPENLHPGPHRNLTLMAGTAARDSSWETKDLVKPRVMKTDS